MQSTRLNTRLMIQSIAGAVHFVQGTIKVLGGLLVAAVARARAAREENVGSVAVGDGGAATSASFETNLVPRDVQGRSRLESDSTSIRRRVPHEAGAAHGGRRSPAVDCSAVASTISDCDARGKQ